MDEYPIGLGLALAQELTDQTWGFTLKAELTVKICEGRYRCTKLVVTPLPGRGLTSEDLRELPVSRMISNVTRREDIEKELEARFEAATREQSPAVVAATYRYSYAVNDAPVKEMMRILRISRSEVGRQVAEARKQGFLEQTTERKAGGV